jgi:D-alanine-D-alanine ligase
MTTSRTVVVVFGGLSAEHDVSVVSGTAIAQALAGAGFAVEQVVITLDGAWWFLPDGHRRDGRAQQVYDEPGALGATGPVPVGEAIGRLAARADVPVVFIALHGPFGEDGTIQALLAAVDLPYTGSGVAASAIGMDKAIFKRLCRGIGLPVVDWREVRAERWTTDPDSVRTELAAFAAGAGDPRLMVKPARLGSSVGMTLVHDAAELPAALDLALGYDTLALVETYVADARDLEISVIGNDPGTLELYGPGEVIAGHEFYDYAAKYTPGLSETTTTAEVTMAQRAVLQKIARDCYRAIGAEGFARVDFLLAGEDVYLSEINTIPGFTPISLFPTLPAVAGYTFTDVCVRVVDLAVARHDARVRRSLSPGDLPR